MWARDKCCPRRCIEMLGCSPRVEVATMALQPAAQELNPPVLAVVAMLVWRSPPLLPSIVLAKEGVRAGACA